MSTLREALKQLELRGANVATQAAKDGIGSDLVKVTDAARKTLDPITDEEVEAAWGRIDNEAQVGMRTALEAFLNGRWPDRG